MRDGRGNGYAIVFSAAGALSVRLRVVDRDTVAGNALDDALARLGLTRRVVATAPTEAAAPEFARRSDLLVTVPEATTRSAVVGLGLAALPLPREIPPAAVYLSWHQRYDSDPAHVWPRELARTALATSGASP